MEEIHVIFESNGKEYRGLLVPIAGVGSPSVWHLMINSEDGYFTETTFLPWEISRGIMLQLGISRTAPGHVEIS